MTENQFTKCACEQCGGRIEFPSTGIGQTIACPHCGQPTLLTGAAAYKPSRRVWLLACVALLIMVLGGLTWLFFRGKDSGANRGVATGAAVTVSPSPAAPIQPSRPVAVPQAEDFPQFHVPGFEPEMARLQEMFRLHHARAFTDCTLWDQWLPHSTLWAAVGPAPSAAKARAGYRGVFLNRRIDAQGYVSMQQHRGLAHSEGWPFPAYQQSTGSGWHFSTLDEVWGIQNFALKALTSTAGWEITGAVVEGIDPASGLKLRATGDVITLTTPPFACGTIVAPFARLEWAAKDLSSESRPQISWLLQGEKVWSPARHADFPPLANGDGMRYANIPLYPQPGYAGLLTRYRLTFDRARGSSLTIKSLITSVDTRHPITNPNFIRGSAEYFAWTGDVPFLQNNIGRIRTALRYALSEFGVRERKMVRVPWVGHDGRSGLEILPDGKKNVRIGLGVGNNYWDLLPFGGDDALATIYLYDALGWLAKVEAEIASHPDWAIPSPGASFAAADLTGLAAEIKATAGRVFWNEATGRFNGWRDLAGQSHDYGFTFLNLEAIHYGFATEEQSHRILDWLDGRRDVAGDTAKGADIYHWRFGPRATTRRNLETYQWVWSAPESIPWGGQVQDGGAVLGFTYFDLMARLQTLGPDAAWQRLLAVIQWFDEVQSDGGYRAYYSKPGRGTLQGGGPAGGLGMDQEFMESVLVPQVMLYGFLGFSLNGDTYSVKPRLPKGWPSLTVTGIHFHNQVLDITAYADGRVDKRPHASSVASGNPLPSAPFKNNPKPSP